MWDARAALLILAHAPVFSLLHSLSAPLLYIFLLRSHMSSLRSSLTPRSNVNLGWASWGCRAEHYLLRQLQSKVAYTQEDTSNQRPQNVNEIQRYATTTGLWRKPGGPELSFEVDDQPPAPKTKQDELLSYKVEENVCKLASFQIEHVPQNESKHLGNPASGWKQAAELIFSWVTSYCGLFTFASDQIQQTSM